MDGLLRRNKRTSDCLVENTAEHPDAMFTDLWQAILLSTWRRENMGEAWIYLSLALAIVISWIFTLEVRLRRKRAFEKLVITILYEQGEVNKELLDSVCGNKR